MLAGEYAVLQGHAALACTTGMHMELASEKTDNNVWTLESDLWDQPKFVQPSGISDPLCIFSQAVQWASTKFGIPGGHIKITRGLPTTYGVGSSSALRLGVLASLKLLSEPRTNGKGLIPFSEPWLNSVMFDAWSLQRAHQPDASGYDIATQALGGPILFKNTAWESMQQHPSRVIWRPYVERLPAVSAFLNRYVTVMVGGQGALTGPTMEKVLNWIGQENLWPQVKESGTALVAQIIASSQDAGGEGPLISVGQGSLDVLANVKRVRRLFEQSPAFPRSLGFLLGAVPGLDEVWSYKMTGAGGEDAVLIFGLPAYTMGAIDTLKKAGWHALPGGFGETGLQCKVANDAS